MNLSVCKVSEMYGVVLCSVQRRNSTSSENGSLIIFFHKLLFFQCVLLTPLLHKKQTSAFLLHTVRTLVRDVPGVNDG